MISGEQNSQWGFFAVLAAAFLWGTTGTAATFAPSLNPLAIGAVAMGGGGLLQALLARSSIVQYWQHIVCHKALLAVGVVSVAIYPLAFYSSMHYAGITVGTVVSIGTAPLFTALLERVFDGKKLSMLWFVSFVFGVVGVLFLSVGEALGSTAATDTTLKTLGIGLGLLAGLTYSLYSWIAKKLMQNGIAAKAAMGMIFGLGALILLPSLYFSGGNVLAQNINIAVLAYMMLIPMFIGYLLFGYGLKHIPASRAITLTLFEPLVAALLAILLVGEQLAPIGWLGMGLIFVCLAILSKAK
ncbi:MAG: EamA family transporter [Vitreoscilla sp.]|nr:EamA family transporter [Vitreoscilla sp.]